MQIKPAITRIQSFAGLEKEKAMLRQKEPAQVLILRLMQQQAREQHRILRRQNQTLPEAVYGKCRHSAQVLLGNLALQQSEALKLLNLEYYFYSLSGRWQAEAAQKEDLLDHYIGAVETDGWQVAADLTAAQFAFLRGAPINFILGPADLVASEIERCYSATGCFRTQIGFTDPQSWTRMLSQD